MLTVSLTLNKPGTIYYTTNGSTPTTSSPVYTQPLIVISTTTLKYFAVDLNEKSSVIQSQTYTYDPLVPAVTATPDDGIFYGWVKVTLTANKPCTIYYTTDGTNPTTSSPVYSSAITIKATTNLKFMARDSAGNQSINYSKNYTLQKLINPRIGAACQTCHDAYAHDKEQDGLKVNHPYFDCWGCHSTSDPRQRSALTFYLSCSGCHTEAHNMTLYSQFPVEIPKYPGFLWTEPDPYEIYKGDVWKYSVFSGDMIVYTNKRKDVNKTDILNWYKQKIVEYGWEYNSSPTIYLYTDGSFKMALKRVDPNSYSRARIHLFGDDTNGWRLIITYGAQ